VQQANSGLRPEACGEAAGPVGRSALRAFASGFFDKQAKELDFVEPDYVLYIRSKSTERFVNPPSLFCL